MFIHLWWKKTFTFWQTWTHRSRIETYWNHKSTVEFSPPVHRQIVTCSYPSGFHGSESTGTLDLALSHITLKYRLRPHKIGYWILTDIVCLYFQCITLYHHIVVNLHILDAFRFFTLRSLPLEKKLLTKSHQYLPWCILLDLLLQDTLVDPNRRSPNGCSGLFWCISSDLKLALECRCDRIGLSLDGWLSLWYNEHMLVDVGCSFSTLLKPSSKGY